MMSIYCNQCGTPNPERARFCSSCGSAVDPGEEALVPKKTAAPAVKPKSVLVWVSVAWFTVCALMALMYSRSAAATLSLFDSVPTYTQQDYASAAQAGGSYQEKLAIVDEMSSRADERIAAYTSRYGGWVRDDASKARLWFFLALLGPIVMWGMKSLISGTNRGASH